jgi:hypothetical protein
MNAGTCLLQVGFLLSTGCSFLFVPSPPSVPSDRTQEAAKACKPSSIWPTADAISAGVGAVNIAIAAGADAEAGVSWYGAEMSRGAGLGLGASQLVLYGASAAYGFVQLSRCRELQKEVQSGTPPPSNAAPVDWVSE